LGEQRWLGQSRGAVGCRKASGRSFPSSPSRISSLIFRQQFTSPAAGHRVHPAVEIAAYQAMVVSGLGKESSAAGHCRGRLRRGRKFCLIEFEWRKGGSHKLVLAWRTNTTRLSNSALHEMLISLAKATGARGRPKFERDSCSCAKAYLANYHRLCQQFGHADDEPYLGVHVRSGRRCFTGRLNLIS